MRHKIFSVCIILSLAILNVSFAQEDNCEPEIIEALMDYMGIRDEDSLFEELDSLPEPELDRILEEAGVFEIEERCEDQETDFDDNRGNDDERSNILTGASTANPDLNPAEFDIMPVPSEFPEYARDFVWYTHINAPNGGLIRIFAQDQVTIDQIIHARDILNFYLTNVPNSTYGADKSAVANAMANNEAILVLLNGHDRGNPPRVQGQELYSEELVVEGSPAYINNDYENHRDATFEEILHLVHDAGIGVDGANTQSGALPEFQRQIREATNNALPENNSLWAYGAEQREWLDELSQENSLTQEYLAAVVDSYYGLWGAFDEPRGMWGFYIAQTREDIAVHDPLGYGLMQAFFSPYLTYMARIDSGFEGTFSMTFDPAQPYTSKSQYLLHAALTGNNNSNLIGNDQNNLLSGNTGDNLIDGLGGDDTIIYAGIISDYNISINDDSVQIIGIDGTDTLINIEHIQFTDQTLDL